MVARDSESTCFKEELAASFAQLHRLAQDEITRLEAAVQSLQAENTRLAGLVDPDVSKKISTREKNSRQRSINKEVEDSASRRLDRDYQERQSPSKRDGEASVAGGDQAPGLEVRNPYSSCESSGSVMHKSWLSESADLRSMKNNVRSALVAKPFQISDLYYNIGAFQRIARSPVFEQVTLAVIFCNAVWISIDLDLNPADSLLDAAPVFKVVENIFCAFFTLELLVRFGAFKRKASILKDRWFLFDSLLVMMMVLETWIFPVFWLITGLNVLQGVNSVSILRMFRLLRLTRIAKMMHAVPEMMILIKGMIASVRSVCVTSCLLGIMTYVFAVIFKMLTKGTVIGEDSYRSVPQSMLTLVVEGMMPDNGDMMRELGVQQWYLAALFFMFIFLASLTFMNMLIGFLCDIVSGVSAEEKDMAEVNVMRERLQSLMYEIDTNYDGRVSKAEVIGLMCNKSALQTLMRFGVDIYALIDDADHIFTEDSAMTFEEFIEVLFQFRATHLATIRTISSLRKSFRQDLSKVTENLEQIFNKLNGNVKAHGEVLDVSRDSGMKSGEPVAHWQL